MKKTSWKQNILLLFLSVLAAVLVLEVLLRLVPTGLTDYRSNMRYVPDNVVGFRLKPGQQVCATSVCYKIDPVTINSVGFRDSEPVKGHYEIGILGDSFMEAAQTPEGIYTSKLIERILGVNVLSGAIGGYGTINQFYCYREYMARYKPRVVLLFFCGNDLSDNSCKTSLSKGSLCADVTRKGEIVVTPTNARLMEFKDFVRVHCRSCYGAAKLWVSLRGMIDERRQASPADAGQFKPGNVSVGPVNGRGGLSDEQLITAHFLRRLDEEVKKNDGTLVVVPVHADNDVMKFLSRVCRENEVRLLRLDSGLERYAARFNLPEPGFGYRCDRHWNPLAHFVAANMVSKYLLDQGLVSGKDRPRTVAAIERNLTRSPEGILGPVAFSQIYRNGYYRGASNIPEILAGKCAGVTRSP